MRLTKTHREDFVNSVMADVPKIPYKDKITDLIQSLAKEYREKAGITLDMVNAGRVVSTRINLSCVKNKSTELLAISRGEGGYSAWEGVHILHTYVHGLTSEESTEIEKHPKILELRDKYIDQHNERVSLKVKISGVINGCNTLKEAKGLLPEFEKYLPQEAPKIDRTLPVVGNLVAELSKKGWPAKKTATKKK